MGRDFTKNVNATIRLSIEGGVEFLSSSDERIQATFQEDTSACVMAECRLEAPVTVNLEIAGRIIIGKGGGLTTGSLRFPHLLKDIVVRFSETRKSEAAKVCIVGPGLDIPEKGILTCPQFVELLVLFPNAEFLLLDNDKEALEKMEQQYKQLKFAAYDPTAHRMNTLAVEGNNFLAPKSYQTVLKEMGEQLGKVAKAPKNATKMLRGFGKLQQVFLNVNSEKIDLRSFDINSSEFNAEDQEKFDVVIATMSILLAMKECSENPLDILCKHLAVLKDNGSFYSDSILIHELLQLDLSDIRYLEEKLGSKLVIEEIPISDYVKGATGFRAVLPSLSLQEAKAGRGQDISTASLTVFTRKAK